MADYFFNPSSADFVNVFEPASPGYSVTVDGYYDPSGALLAFAPRSAGSAAAATGMYTPSNADVNTVWAAKGSVVYALGCDGGVYHNSVIGFQGNIGAVYTCGTYFNTQSGMWYIQQFKTGQSLQLDASGPLPANAVYISVSYVKTITDINGNGIVATNNASTITAIGTASNIWIETTGTVSGASGSHGASFAITVKLYNASKALISTTNFTFTIDTDES